MDGLVQVLKFIDGTGKALTPRESLAFIERALGRL